jgi:hypothetical protein
MDGGQVTLIGRVNFRNDNRLFGIKHEDRFSHVYVIGKTGTGKSTLIETMALQDLERGNGFALIDPHGDLVARIAARIPASQRERVNLSQHNRPCVALLNDSFHTRRGAFMVVSRTGLQVRRTPENDSLAGRKKAPVASSTETDSLADRWLKHIKGNPVIATLVVVGTVVAAVIGFWEKAADFYERLFGVAISLAAFHLSSTSDTYREEEWRTCKFDVNGRVVRMFKPDPYAEENRALSLDFVFTNKSNADAIINAVDLDISAAGGVAGGRPGIVIPNHTYIIDLKHEVGVQSFPLTPVYRIPGNDTGSFTIVFSPASEGIGLCWTMRAVFHSNLGKVKSEDFSVIMVEL